MKCVSTCGHPDHLNHRDIVEADLVSRSCNVKRA